MAHPSGDALSAEALQPPPPQLVMQIVVRRDLLDVRPSLAFSI